MRSMMKSWFTVVTAAAMSGLLAACAAPLLAPDDVKNFCHVAVKEKFGSPTFHANVFSSTAGGLAGAGAGALAGLQGGMAAIFTVPLGAVIGAAGGTACAAAGLNHPNADADFEKLLHAADASSLKRAMEADLNAPRAECSHARREGSATTEPDSIIEIEKIDAGMKCLFGQQEYWIEVQWRTLEAKTGRQLNWTTTRYAQKSLRTVDDWFANSDQAVVEIERVLAIVGRQMAAQLLSGYTMNPSSLRSLETGEVTAK
jgi:hypothetical protein